MAVGSEEKEEKGEYAMMHDLFYGVSEQGKAGKHRMDNARALLNAVRWRGTMYMAGYSIECLLKTKLMRMFDCRHLRELEEELQRRGSLPFGAASSRINSNCCCDWPRDWNDCVRTKNTGGCSTWSTAGCPPGITPQTCEP